MNPWDFIEFVPGKLFTQFDVGPGWWSVSLVQSLYGARWQDDECKVKQQRFHHHLRDHYYRTFRNITRNNKTVWLKFFAAACEDKTVDDPTVFSASRSVCCKPQTYWWSCSWKASFFLAINLSFTVWTIVKYTISHPFVFKVGLISRLFLVAGQTKAEKLLLTRVLVIKRWLSGMVVEEGFDASPFVCCVSFIRNWKRTSCGHYSKRTTTTAMMMMVPLQNTNHQPAEAPSSDETTFSTGNRTGTVKEKNKFSKCDLNAKLGRLVLF